MVEPKVYENNNYISGIGVASRFKMPYERIKEILEKAKIPYEWRLEGNTTLIFFHPKFLNELEKRVNEAISATD